MDEKLEHWQWILDQRSKDLALELERDEDSHLIRLLEDGKQEAEQKIKELTNE
jgi:hypothetical protein